MGNVTGKTLEAVTSESEGSPTSGTGGMCKRQEHGSDPSSRCSQKVQTTTVAIGSEQSNKVSGSGSRSADTPDRNEGHGKRKSESKDDPDKCTLPETSWRADLPRSSADRTSSPDFAPPEVLVVEEEPTWVPLHTATVKPAAPIDTVREARGSSEVAGREGSKETPSTPCRRSGLLRRTCDLCVRKKTRCDGNDPCEQCKKKNTECTRSAIIKRDGASRTLAPSRMSQKKHSADLGSHSEEVPPPRCRHEGCLEPPLHGRMAGRPSWCQLHFVSQSSHHPLRCAVLQPTKSGDCLACWKETTWGWPGKPPNRCELHKIKGQQQQDVVEEVPFLRGVFEEVVWPKLLERGWRREIVRCKSPYFLWMPPNVVRGSKDFKARVDYFDTPPQVIKYCLRTQEHHGWMMKEYRDLKARLSMSPVTYRRQSNVDGKCNSSRQSTAKPPAKERQPPSPPATSNGLTHQLFSFAPSSKRADRDERGGSSGGIGASVASGATDFGRRGSPETIPRRTLAHVGLQQAPREAQTLSPAQISHQAARRREQQGTDPAIVTKRGLVRSEQVMAGFLARMGRRGGNTGGPMGALAASLRDFDGYESHIETRASGSTRKRPCREISDVKCAPSELHRTQGTAGDQGYPPFQNDGLHDPAVKRRAVEAQPQHVGQPPARRDGMSKYAGCGCALLEEADALAPAQVRLVCHTTAPCIKTAARDDPDDDSSKQVHGGAR